jgi:hypothetical protein
VVERPAKWVSNHRAATGEMMLTCGEAGRANSSISLDMAARIRVGADWADGSGQARLGCVLIVSAEILGRQPSILGCGQ